MRMINRFIANVAFPTAFMIAVVVGTAPAGAATIDWAFWNGGSAGNIPATVGSNTALYSGDVGNLVIGGTGVSPGSGGGVTWGPTTTYADGLIVNNAPPVAGNIIQLFGGTSNINTVTFGTAVVNPVMAIWSLGQTSDLTSFIFGAVEPFVIVAGGPSNEGISNGWTNNSSIFLIPQGVGGVEGNGTIQFLGTFSSISWTNPTNENWYGFTVGIAETPLPAALPLFASGLGAMGLFGWRRKRKNAAAIAAA